MRLDLKALLLLPASVAANILEAALEQPDPTITALPSTSIAPLNEAFAAPPMQDALLAIQTAAPNPVAAPHNGRSYNPNPAFLRPADELAKREVVTGVAQGVGVTANVGATQVPTVTTYWPQMVVDGVTKWPQIVYTQTFAAVPDQWPSAGVGSIGYGDEGSGGKNTKRGTGAKEEGNAGVVVDVRIGAVVAVAAAAGLVML